jgi:hypothetical protein
MAFNETTRAKLAAVSTATLTTVLMKRGLRNVFIADLTLINPTAPRMVGPAYTLRYIPAREDIDHLKVFEDRAIRSAAPSRNACPAMSWSSTAARITAPPRRAAFCSAASISAASQVS